MYYEEKIIDGVLHWRSTPTGKWIAKTSEQLTSRIAELEAIREQQATIIRDREDEIKELEAGQQSDTKQYICGGRTHNDIPCPECQPIIEQTPSANVESSNTIRNPLIVADSETPCIGFGCSCPNHVAQPAANAAQALEEAAKVCESADYFKAKAESEKQREG